MRRLAVWRGRWRRDNDNDSRRRHCNNSGAGNDNNNNNNIAPFTASGAFPARVRFMGISRFAARRADHLAGAPELASERPDEQAS